MPDLRYLVVVGGPTASGKTKIAIELARFFHTHILSADSRQFYREMNIGTAKPSAAELAQAPHHFINSLSIHDAYDVGKFETDALRLLEELFQQHPVVVVAGGSGLFIRALTEGLDYLPVVPESVSEQVRMEFKQHGLQWLGEQVRLADPVYFTKVDQHNPRRLLRALEVCRATGRPFSDYLRQTPKPRPFRVIHLLLDWEREPLVRRIEQRVEQMVAAGLVKEAEALYPHRHLNALQTVGYQELFEFMDGKMSLAEAIEKIKVNTRRYAKRQMTWFRKYGDWQAFAPGNFDKIIPFVEAEMEAGSHLSGS